MHIYTGPPERRQVWPSLRAESSPNVARFVPGGLHKDGIVEKVDGHHRQWPMQFPTVGNSAASFVLSCRMAQWV